MTEKSDMHPRAYREIGVFKSREGDEASLRGLSAHVERGRRRDRCGRPGGAVFSYESFIECLLRRIIP